MKIEYVGGIIVCYGNRYHLTMSNQFLDIFVRYLLRFFMVYFLKNAITNFVIKIIKYTIHNCLLKNHLVYYLHKINRNHLFYDRSFFFFFGFN